MDVLALVSTSSLNTVKTKKTEWNSRSRAAAVERGSMRARGSWDVVVGELDVISMLNETEKSDARRQGGSEVRHRHEDVVTKELATHGARGNEEGRNARRTHAAKEKEKEKEKRRKGEKEKRRKGEKEKRRKGEKERRRGEGEKERRRKGEKEKRRKGEKEKRRKGEKEKRRKGEKEKEMMKRSARPKWGVIWPQAETGRIGKSRENGCQTT